MALTFPRAPRVSVGDIPKSRDMIALANAANRKDLSGLGDNHYRLSDYCLNWARQIRNSDEFGGTPSMCEYWEIYAYLDADLNGNNTPMFPIAGPGLPEGSNTTSLPGAFLFGNASANFPGEEGRINEPSGPPLWLGIAGFPTDPEGQWELAKNQRGAIDPLSLEQNVPAIEAARFAQHVAWSYRVPHGKSTGGFFPTPLVLLSSCGSDEESGDGIQSYQIKFTALRDDVSVPSNHGSVSTVGGRSVITYAGSCPFWTEFTAANHVQNISRDPYYFVIFLADGSFDILIRKDWLEGPYTGEGQLYRYSADHFSRAVWAFDNDFNGTEAQRNPDDFDIEKIAFSFDEFLGRQYHLAPNRAVSIGADLYTEYPQARLTSDKKPISEGTLLKFGGKATSFGYTPGFVMSGFFAKASNLAEALTLEVLNGTKIVAKITLTPDAPAALKYLTDGVVPNPLSVRLANKAKFTAPGEIIFEANELLEYKPDHWDAYLLLRLSATRGGDEFDGSFLDGSGVDELNATQIYKNYAALGCIVNTAAAGIRTQEIAINPNPVYDSNRRLLNSLFRMARRQEFLSYENDAAGRPIVRFKRYAFGQHNNRTDIFKGIAPDWRSVSAVEQDVVYVVRSHTGGTVKYAGRRYNHAERFTGRDAKDFERTGDAELLEYEGILPKARKNGWSNQWIMSEELHFYHWSPTSLWYPDHYADWYARGNRCGTYAYFMSGEMSQIVDLPVYPGNDASFRNLHLSPEFPSGWTYALGFNASASDDFCKSCQVYKAPYEIISATVEFVPGGDDIVVLTFKEPFQRDPSAPTSISRNAAAWSVGEVAALRAETYRTTDNGLRENMLYKALGTNASWKIGDGAMHQNGGIDGIQSLPDNPYGAILPRFFFTSLVRKPFEDGNDTWDSTDTRIIAEELTKLELKIKCWSEGAVDEFTSVQNICGGGSKPYDFTYENLKFKAFGGINIGRGHGPIVNTTLDAETFNQIAACLDELHMYRIEGIMQLEVRALNYETTIDVAPTFGGYICPVAPSGAAYWDGSPPSPSLDTTSAWGPASHFEATAGAAISLCGPSGNALGMTSFKTDFEYRYVPVTGFENAIPPNVQGLIDNRNVGVIGTITRTQDIPVKRQATNFAETSCADSGGGAGAFAGPNLHWESAPDSPSTTCAMIANGQLTAGSPPGGSFKVCTYPDSSVSGFAYIQGSSIKRATFNALNDEGSAIIVVPLTAPEVDA